MVNGLMKPPNSSAQKLTGESAVMAAVLGLGTNTDVLQLDRAATLLSRLGRVTASGVTSGEDFTGRCTRIYHNTAVMLNLVQPMTQAQLTAHFKRIESILGRDPSKKTAEFDYEVAIDIDVLALSSACDDAKHTDAAAWLIDVNCLPFKAHEVKNLAQIAPFLWQDNYSLSEAQSSDLCTRHH